MTSEVEALKTNEFLRRRKLRIQQVREQSKDIAKKIRQRVSTEKFRHLVDLDSTKGKIYLEQQDKLVKKLQHLYSKSLDNVGASHKKAAGVTGQVQQEKTDLSKQRARTAAAELRRQKQEKLDQRKKSLDRKLLARDVANELSREKSSSTVNKLKSSSVKTAEESVQAETIDNNPQGTSTSEFNKEKDNPVTNEMATQWDEPLPPEWEPHIPVLSIPTDDTPRGPSPKQVGSKSDRSRRANLFALSDEMPLSLRGGLTSVPEEGSTKPSFTLVTDYLQNRNLRLRENDILSKKPNEELQRIKQTLIRTRAARAEVPAKEPNNVEKPSKPLHTDRNLSKKSSVTVYNHSTRDLRDVPHTDRRLVFRDSQINEDAYSLAMKESSIDNNKKENQKKVQDLRNKIAMTKQNVEKEYKDTMTFLKSLPKDNSKPIRTAYKDDQQQQMHKECRQRRLQQEFRTIQRECKKHPHSSSRAVGNISKSPVRVEPDDDFNAKDFQYSWMPVPESDGNLAIHTIPTTLKENKSGNAVRFSKIDSYHEYRSRHKHTPPTKDTSYRDKTQETVTSEDGNNSDSSSGTDTSSVENLKLDKTSKNKSEKNSDDSKLSDAERIIIYKILDTKKDAKQNSKVIKDIARSLDLMTKNRLQSISSRQEDVDVSRSNQKTGKPSKTRVSVEQLKEGIYKTVNEDGMAYNIMSYYTTNIEYWQSTNRLKPWWDNMTSVNLNDSVLERSEPKQTTGDSIASRSRKCCAEVVCSCETTEMNPNVVHRSPASTSILSFKTASNDKATSHNMQGHTATEETLKPLDGMIKLVDEKGQESGKFYIGATGYLKDDDYEVIIQLRKKDATKTESTEMQNVVVDKATSVETNVEPLTSEDNVGSTSHVGIQSTLTEAKCQVSQYASATANNKISEDNQRDERILYNVDFDSNQQNQEQSKPKQFVDQGVYTSAQDSFAIPSNFSKANIVEKPAASVGTQTTPDSPVQRPVFIHMSSSTSTAYMSPPEFILPSFFRRADKLNSMSDETSDMHDLRNEMIDHTHPDIYENNAFDTSSLTKKSKILKSKQSPTHSPIKTGQTCQKFKAPPNTARSTSSGYDNRKHCCKKKLYSTNSIPMQKCPKCQRHSQLKLYLNSLPRKSKQNIPPNNKSTRTMRQAYSSQSQKVSNKTAKTRTPYQTFGRNLINPVVKRYVDKLLMMNKAGLQTVEVMDQVCSAVMTPGSSIIDVPENINTIEPMVEPKISLQQFKDSLTRKILGEFELPQTFEDHENIEDQRLRENVRPIKVPPLFPKKKFLHKVKSLNISKNLIPCKSVSRQNSSTKAVCSVATSDTLSPEFDDRLRSIPSVPLRTKTRSKSSPSPRQISDDKLVKLSKVDIKRLSSSELNKISENNINTNKIKTPHVQTSQGDIAFNSDYDSAPRTTPLEARVPLCISTQTSRMIDEEINYIKLAESKLHNMEKIADLTEKCTQRLSNLAKVLDEVRRSKSIAYSQISDPPSDTDRTSTKNSDTQLTSTSTYEPIIEIREKSPPQSEQSGKTDSEKNAILDIPKSIPKPKLDRKTKSPPLEKPRRSYISPSHSSPSRSSPSRSSPSRSSPIRSSPSRSSPTHAKTQPVEHQNTRNRGKPPPALSRKCLKRAPECVVPHELSTVLEVDSPLSSKFKNQSSRTDLNTRNEPSKASEFKENKKETQKNLEQDQENNPDLLQSNANLSRQQTTKLLSDSSNEKKLQMMDLRKFNEIMLKPFISIQEYAKQCNVANIEEPSNTDNLTREEVVNEELSSLHSDGSLPDVIAELLKRDLIKEPFKFEAASNANSTTASSESTVSAFALSKNKKKSSEALSNKENIVETSDSLSISSNPDLESAFKKMGMGWASSTLRKTKERLALSSSSNTSSSSLSQYKLKSSNKQEFPALVTDSMSTSLAPRNLESSKNAEQQTSNVNSMTVKQFLTNELAKKITFSKSHRNDTQEDDFISLYETKMPEELKHSSKMVYEERSVDSNTRARTSTPVQLFKSLTYHTSSSSNLSNGFFSNDLSSVKGTSNSLKNNSTSEKDDLTIPNFTLRVRKGNSDCSKSD